MKKKSLIGLCLLPLLLAMVALFPACKKNNEGAPHISDVRQYVASPQDTVLSTGNPNTSPPIYGNGGNYVVIQGSNLQNPTEIDFDGVASSFNPALITSNNAVVPIPTINYTTIDTSRLYSITYKTKAGSTTFWFKLGPAKPTISAISNVFANPGDSVYVYGANLVLVQQFIYGGTKITSYKSSSDGSSLGFLMPPTTPTNLITVTTKSGTVVDTIRATPTISGISNENPSAGDSVYIYGTYLKSIQSLSFAGTPITTFTASADTKSIGFVMPPLLSQTGPVSVTTKFGTGTSPYPVNTFTYLKNGVIENMENVGSGMGGWWAAGYGCVDNTSSGAPGWFTQTTDFDGILGTNHTEFIAWNSGALSSGDGQWYSGNGIDLTNNEQWVPAANVADDPGTWALKLEISVPHAWNGGSLVFSPGNGFIYRWEPWNTQSGTVAYKTKGWITLTIPLTSFRLSDPTLGDGMGAPLAKLTDLVGASGNSPTTYIYVHNYGTAKTATGFYGAIDNVRVEKIK